MEKKSDRSFRFSDSFKSGFAAGFSAPASFFNPPKLYTPGRQFSGNVNSAWNEVGAALSRATKEQGIKVEQKTRAEKRRTSKTAA